MKLFNGGESLLHMFVCFVVAMVVAAIYAHTSATVTICVVSGFLVSMAAGLGKEFGDSRATGNAWCWNDMLWNLIGALSGCLFGFVKLLI